MKWPWVSRAVVESERRIADLHGTIAERWKTLYEDVAEKYHELVRATMLPETSHSPVVMPERTPSIIDQVIREQAPTDPRLKAHLRSYASKLKRDGMSEGDIALALTQWSTTEPMVTE